MQERKNRRNLRKHGISFETGSLVFEDPCALSQPDEFSTDEERWLTLGEVVKGAVVLVVHAWFDSGSDDVIRIISARAAAAHEKRAYEETFKRTKKEIATILASDDANIDFADASPAIDWSRAEIGKFYRPAKKSVTIRLDIDILAWLKKYGRGYQTRANLLCVMRWLVPLVEAPRKRVRNIVTSMWPFRISAYTATVTDVSVLVTGR